MAERRPRKQRRKRSQASSGRKAGGCLRALLVRACEAEGFELLKGTIAETARRTHDIFLAVVEVPAVAAGWRAEN